MVVDTIALDWTLRFPLGVEKAQGAKGRFVLTVDCNWFVVAVCIVFALGAWISVENHSMAKISSRNVRNVDDHFRCFLAYVSDQVVVGSVALGWNLYRSLDTKKKAGT